MNFIEKITTGLVTNTAFAHYEIEELYHTGTIKRQLVVSVVGLKDMQLRRVARKIDELLERLNRDDA